jgi:peptidoglycan hydrolase-like protein with peptidoglycan-binding domain
MASPASQSQIDLSWTPSTDNIAVIGYTIYRNGAFLGTTANTTYIDTGLSAGTTYTYTIDAFDLAGNVSGLSAPASATTQSAPSVGTGGSSGGSGGGGGGGGGGGYYAPPAPPTETTSLTIAQMESLLASLEAELQALEAEAGGGTAPYAFTRDLTIGSTGPDVKALQQYLNSHGFPVVSTPGYAGSLGYETEHFGPATAQALALFQASVGITPASGYFGPKTMAYLNGGTVPTATTPATPSPAPMEPTAPVVTTPVPTPTTPSVSSSALSLGSAGARVTTLQTILVQDGYLSAGGFTQGTFDPATLRAVETFQCTQDITCVYGAGYGMVGPTTAAALGL